MEEVKTNVIPTAAKLIITTPSPKVQWSARVISSVRYAVCSLTTQNPVLWKRWKGRQNPFADLEGPYYIFGAPSRQLQEGKAVIAAIAELKEFGPYLLKVRVRGPGGELVKNARFDWWQADTTGHYFHETYNLRGKFQTDENGDVEILTVAPGKYGPQDQERAGHFHFILQDKSGRYKSLTSQMYVCRANDPTELETDFLNVVRETRPINMLNSWATSDDKFMELPTLSPDDVAARERLDWWNAKIAEWTAETSIVAGAEVEIRMNA